jgi:hypothetical protein
MSHRSHHGIADAPDPAPVSEKWNGLADRYTQDQLVEVVLIVWNYTQLTMFQNTLGVQLPPDIEGLPKDPAAR